MKTPLNISKISPPRLPQILDRSRLIQRLEQNQDKKLILILGQAAQGKSTLAASYAQKSKTPWVWLNLEIEESDPVNLFYLLVQSLQHTLNELDLSPLLDYPAIIMGPREEIPLYREWTHAIFDRIPASIRIFLDGLDRLAPDAPSYRFLQVLLENAPPNISLIMLSREVPPLEIQRLKMDRKAAIIENKDLAFTVDEIKAFFRGIRSISFTNIQLKRIHQFTEGWVGGLILLSESLDRLPEELRDQYLSKYLSEQFKVEVFQYFGEEIFSSQSSLVQEFLVKSAIFEVLEPGLIKEFTGIENAEDILWDLSRRNLFVQSVYDTQKGWLFRYHQLFKDFLKSKFESQIDKKEKPSLFFKAGSLFEQKGNLEESVKFFLEAKAYPEEVRGHLLSLAFLIETSIVRGRDSIPLGVLLEQGEMLLQSLSADRYPYERAVLCLQVGFGFALRGNHRKGLTACENAYLISKSLGDLQLQAYSLCNAVVALGWLGEFALAEDVCEKVGKLMEKLAYPELRCLYQIHYSALCVCNGELEKAGHLIHLAQAGIEEYGLIYLYPATLLHDLLSKSYLDKYAEAEKIADRLISLTSSMNNLVLQGIASLILGVSFYRKEDFQNCKELIEHSKKILSSDEARIETYLNMIKIMMSLVSYHLKEHGSDDKELYEALDYFSHISSYVYLVDVHFAMSLLKYKRGNVAEATAHLLAGFKIAKQRQYHHLWVLNRNDLVKICTLAIELDVREAMDYAAHLLSTRLAAQAGPEIERLSKHSKPKIRKKAREIKVAIHRANVPRIQIRTLGGFRVLRGNASIQEKEWQGGRPKLLLKAIIAHESRGVSQDIIVEDLWPEGRPEAVEKNFKVTLHRLRKALEPKPDKTLGSSYIHIKDKFIFLDKELCHVDVDEFLSLLEKGKSREKDGDAKGALSLYEEAVELYKGDFLVEDLYAPWADIKRQELRKKYIELLYKTAELYESRGASNKATTCYKKVVQTDPVSEKAYQRLMTLYSNRGMRSAALTVYEECKKALQTELDTAPDEITTSIYKKVLEI